MCTCIMIKSKHSFFGRNMDLDYELNEKMIIVPKNYSLRFKFMNSLSKHFAFFGLGIVIDNYPLLAEGGNEYGLAIATLNFPENAHYNKVINDKNNITPYELPLLLLATCKTIKEAKTLLNNINIVDYSFSDSLSLTSIHYMISDKNESIVIEQTKDKLNIFDNPYNVLTNNPPFPYHMENIKNYINLSTNEPINTFSKKLEIKPYSFGMGLLGLPGDYSSSSRFIRSLFIKENIIFENITDFFYCLDSVKMLKGIVKTNSDLEYTRYSSCIDLNECVYYYKKYDSSFYVYKLYDYNLDNHSLLII